MSVHAHARNPGEWPTAPPEPVVIERNRYFTGKFMAARDFAADTEYLLSRHRLHNRLLHGWGIVCGLEPVPHPRPECAQEWVVVGAGLALDCRGRELVLLRDTAFRLPLPPHDSDGDGDRSRDGGGDHSPEGEDRDDADKAGQDKNGTANCAPRHDPFLLCARFHCAEVEPVPALYAEDTCDPHHTECNRYREGTRLVIADVTPGCWPADDCGGENDTGDRYDAAAVPADPPDCGCAQDPDQEDGLTPYCPCADLVPLARVIPQPGGGYRLDLDGRRTQPPPPALLTHITRINWPHGGSISLTQLGDDLAGELRIGFDRPLRAIDACDARGVNAFTFAVQYATGPTETLEFLPYPDDTPPRLTDDRCTAVFTIDPDYLNSRGRRALRDATVFISLRCDFIPDFRGIPVDGNHLRGKLPSGDGIEGGLFESWFTVRENDRRDDS